MTRGPLTTDEIRRRGNEIGIARYYRADGTAHRLERDLAEDIPEPWAHLENADRLATLPNQRGASRMTNVVSIFSRGRGFSGAVECVASSPETGDIQISREPGGWRVDHVDFDGDHAGCIDANLPSRLEAMHCELAYALQCIATEIGRNRRPDGAA